MAITLTEFPSGVTFPSGFPFAISTKAGSNAFPTGNSFPDMRKYVPVIWKQLRVILKLTVSASEFSSLPSTVTSVFNAALTAQKSGLSTGAIVGVSVGAAVAGLIIIGLIILLWKRKQKTNSSESLNSVEKAIVQSGNSSDNVSPASDGADRPRHAEIDGEVVYEVQGAREPQKPFEADHTHTRAELDSGWRGWEAPAMKETDLSKQTLDEVETKVATARQQNKSRRHVP